MKRPTRTPSHRQQHGFTLIELMITVAILAVISGIAISAYTGFVREANLGAARANMEPLRIALEDYWLENGDPYPTGDWDPAGSKTLETGNLAWKPDGDKGMFVYNVALTNTGYSITVTHSQQTDEPVVESFH